MAEVWESSEGPSFSVVSTAGGGGGSRDSAVYIVNGTESKVAATLLVAGEAPEYVENASGELLIRTNYDAKRIGPGTWKFTVNYSRDDQDESQQEPEENSWTVKFTTTGGTHKITNSLETVARGERSPGTDPAPDLRGVIGWDGKKAEGCEIIVPKLEIEVTMQYAPGMVTQDFVCNLARATGKTNEGDWLDFAEGELLFLGADGAKEIPLRHSSRRKPVPITLKFSASENRENIPLGDMTVTSKKGWQYLWARYKMVEDSGNIIPIPVHWYVERVYHEADFADLFGFGG